MKEMKETAIDETCYREKRRGQKGDGIARERKDSID